MSFVEVMHVRGRQVYDNRNFDYSVGLEHFINDILSKNPNWSFQSVTAVSLMLNNVDFIVCFKRES